MIIQGDLNARTAVERDCVENDKYRARSSQDKVLDAKGKELLDLCKSNELCIINGRKTGDIIGNFTSFQPTGNSVIDYGIVSQSLFDSVCSFKVGNFQPWLSDHCPFFFFFLFLSPPRQRSVARGRDRKENLSTTRLLSLPQAQKINTLTLINFEKPRILPTHLFFVVNADKIISFFSRVEFDHFLS